MAKKHNGKSDLTSSTAIENPSLVISSQSSEKQGWKGTACKHLEKGIDLEKLSIQIAKGSLLQCQGYVKLNKSNSMPGSRKDKKGKSRKAGSRSKDLCKGDGDGWPRTWVCLACGHVGCGSISRRDEENGENSDGKECIGTGHAWQHWLYALHPYALQCGEKLLCWCFPCRCSLEYNFIKPADGEQEKQRLIMVGPSASPLMLQALRVVQEKLVKESAKFMEIQLIDAVVEERPDETLEGAVGIIEAKEEDSVPRRRIVKGLVNLGNTCFFNSVIQNLLAMEVLQDHFDKPAQFIEGPLTTCLRKLYHETTLECQAGKDSAEGDASAGFQKGRKGKGLWENGNGTINPGTLFSAISAQAPRFKGYQQQDSHELLRYLLDCLRAEELCSRRSQGTNSLETLGLNEEGDGQEHICRNADQKNGSFDLATFVDTVFGSELSSTVCCCECGHSSVVYESFLDLSLPIPSKQLAKEFSSSQGYNDKASFSGLVERSPKKHTCKDDKSGNEGHGKGRPSLGSFTNKSDTGTNIHVHSGNLSTSFTVQNITSAVDAITPNKPNLPEDLGWMDYLDSGAQFEGVVFQGPSDASKIMGVIDCDGILPDSSEMAPMREVSNCKSINQNGGSTNQIAESSLMETSGILESPVPAVEGTVGASASQSIALRSNWEFQGELGQQDEPLRMVGDSEILLLPYKDPNVSHEGVDITDNAHKSILVSTKETEGKHLLDPMVLDGDFDGLGQLFDEEEAFFVKKPETEAGKENGGDDLWETEIMVDSEGTSGTNKEEPDNIILPMSVDVCLTAFTSPELLCGENAWECENCSSRFIGDDNQVEGSVAKPEEGKKTQYEQTVITPRNSTGAYEEQVHVENCRGNIGVFEEVMYTNLSDMCAKQTVNSEDLSTFRCYGMVASEADIYKYSNSKQCGEREIGNGIDESYMNSYAWCHTETEPNMFQHVTQLNDLESRKPYTLGHMLGSKISGSDITTKDNSCNYSSNAFSCQAGRVSDETMLTTSGAETSRDNVELVQVECPGTGSLVTEAKKTCTEFGCHSFDSEDCNFSVGEQQNKNVRSSHRGTKLKESKINETNDRQRRLKRDATKIYLISKAPLILTIHFNRFSQDLLGRLSKLRGHVTFQNRLDLRPFLDPRCPDKESCIYHLIGVVEHLGTMRGGHYVAYVRGPEDDEYQNARKDDHPTQSTWYYISDSLVRKSSFSEVLQSEAYMLFYAKATF